MSADLLAFLKTRLDEDYYLAHKFAFTGQSEWDAEMLGRLWWYGDPPKSRSASDPIIQHVARHDPARVLREVEAKRSLIQIVLQYEAKIDGEWGDCHDAEQIGAGLCPDTPTDQIAALRALAAVYRDHPDYRQEWKQ